MVPALHVVPIEVSLRILLLQPIVVVSTYAATIGSARKDKLNASRTMRKPHEQPHTQAHDFAERRAHGQFLLPPAADNPLPPFLPPFEALQSMCWRVVLCKLSSLCEVPHSRPLTKPHEALTSCWKRLAVLFSAIRKLPCLTFAMTICQTQQSQWNFWPGIRPTGLLFSCMPLSQYTSKVKCYKSDCVESCSIELQSFSLGEFQIAPKDRVIVNSPSIFVHRDSGFSTSNCTSSWSWLACIGFAAVKTQIACPFWSFFLLGSIHSWRWSACRERSRRGRCTRRSIW